MLSGLAWTQGFQECPALFDGLIELLGFRARLHRQLCDQYTMAASVLGKRLAALTTGGQGAHNLLVGFLAPGLQLQLTVGIEKGKFVITQLCVVISQIVEQAHGLALILLAHGHYPLLESLAVHADVAEKLPTVQLGRDAQLLHADRTVGSAAMAVHTARSQERPKLPSVHPAAIATIEAQSPTRYVKWRWFGCALMQGQAQPAKRLAQVLKCLALQMFGPEQRRQFLS